MTEDYLHVWSSPPFLMPTPVARDNLVSASQDIPALTSWPETQSTSSHDHCQQCEDLQTRETRWDLDLTHSDLTHQLTRYKLWDPDMNRTWNLSWISYHIYIFSFSFCNNVNINSNELTRLTHKSVRILLRYTKPRLGIAGEGYSNKPSCLKTSHCPRTTKLGIFA